MVFSALIFLSAVVAAFGTYCAEGAECVSKWDAFTASRPNEIGDTLAGFAGSLAFVWIIVTVWLQSNELGAQREELRLTREEMEGHRKATEDMARAMSAQASVFEDERLRRSEERSAELLEELIKAVSITIKSDRGVHFTGEFIDEGDRLRETSLSFGADGTSQENAELYIREAIADLDRVLAHLRDEYSTEFKFKTLCYNFEQTAELKDQLKEIIELFQKLSEADKQRVRNLKIVHFYSAFLDILAMEEVEP